MLPRLLAAIVRVLAWTWRVERPPFPVEGACVAAFWHGEQIPLVALHRGMGLVGMASRSRDGELLAGVLVALGYPVVRGSTSRGGAAALRGALAALRDGGRPALAVDGPRGPAGTVHPGAEALAARAAAPVVCASVEAAGYRFGSWDRLLVPWPFARVRVRYAVWRVGDGALAETMHALGGPRGAGLPAPGGAGGAG